MLPAVDSRTQHCSKASGLIKRKYFSLHARQQALVELSVIMLHSFAVGSVQQSNVAINLIFRFLLVSSGVANFSQGPHSKGFEHV